MYTDQPGREDAAEFSEAFRRGQAGRIEGIRVFHLAAVTAECVHADKKPSRSPDRDTGGVGM